MPDNNRTPKDAVDPRPLHERIATDLRRAILSGDREPGSSLPSTLILTEQFNASNATIQKALGLLKAEGLVVGRAGSAVTVREHRRQTLTPASYSAPVAAGEPYRWLTEVKKDGRQGASTILDVREERPAADVAAALELDEDGVAVLRLQLLTLDSEPCELVKSYYPAELARGTAISERRKIKGGTPTLLAEAGYPPVRTVDRVTAEEPTQEEYEALQLPSPISVLRTLRVVYSHDDRPIEVTVMAKAGHLYELRYEF